MTWLRPPGPMADGLRIGLLGGSFDPAHEGHRHASTLALKTLGLDYVWWLVSPGNPLKQTATSLAHRLETARATARHPRIVVTALERELGSVYTIDTLHRLKRRFPNVRFVWLMGSDNLGQFPHWWRWRDIFNTVPIAVIARPGTALSARFGKVQGTFARALGTPKHLSMARLPAWTILDARRSKESSTTLRAKK